MATRRKQAKNIREGDTVVLTVERVMGMQGRKPKDGRAPLLRVQYDDGTTHTIRGDEMVHVITEK